MSDLQLSYLTKIIVWIVFFCITVDAWAYIDPGTGSMLLQSIIAGISIIIATLFSIRTYLISLWHRLFRKHQSPDESEVLKKPKSEASAVPSDDESNG